MIPFETVVKIEKIKFRFKNTFLGASRIPLWGRFGTLFGLLLDHFGLPLAPLWALFGFLWKLLGPLEDLFELYWLFSKDFQQVLLCF